MQRANRYCGQRLGRSPSPSKRTCLGCQKRAAKFCFRGRVKADRDHNLCRQCYQAIRDRNRTVYRWFLLSLPTHRSDN